MLAQAEAAAEGLRESERNARSALEREVAHVRREYERRLADMEGELGAALKQADAANRWARPRVPLNWALRSLTCAAACVTAYVARPHVRVQGGETASVCPCVSWSAGARSHLLWLRPATDGCSSRRASSRRGRSGEEPAAGRRQRQSEWGGMGAAS